MAVIGRPPFLRVSEEEAKVGDEGLVVEGPHLGGVVEGGRGMVSPGPVGERVGEGRQVEAVGPPFLVGLGRPGRWPVETVGTPSSFRHGKGYCEERQKKNLDVVWYAKNAYILSSGVRV